MTMQPEFKDLANVTRNAVRLDDAALNSKQTTAGEL